jgi:hypothetical protein
MGPVHHASLIDCVVAEGCVDGSADDAAVCAMARAGHAPQQSTPNANDIHACRLAIMG